VRKLAAAVLAVLPLALARAEDAPVPKGAPAEVKEAPPARAPSRQASSKMKVKAKVKTAAKKEKAAGADAKAPATGKGPAEEKKAPDAKPPPCEELKPCPVD
jgi:hypothetical protein